MHHPQQRERGKRRGALSFSPHSKRMGRVWEGAQDEIILRMQITKFSGTHSVCFFLPACFTQTDMGQHVGTHKEEEVLVV